MCHSLPRSEIAPLKLDVDANISDRLYRLLHVSTVRECSIAYTITQMWQLRCTSVRASNGADSSTLSQLSWLHASFDCTPAHSLCTCRTAATVLS